MTVGEAYNEAIKGNFHSLICVIEWLVYEKKVLTLDRDARNIEYILEKYGDDLNPHIHAYMVKREGGTGN